MKWYRCLILAGLLFVFIALPVRGNSGSIAIESKVDRAKMTIGDRVRYSIIVTHGDSIQVEMPEFGINLGAFEILDYNDHDPKRVDDQFVQERDYIISTFDVGEFEIPPVAVRFTAVGDSNSQELKTEIIKIEVESLKPSEEGDIHDIKPPYEIERNWSNIIRLNAAALTLILIGVLIFYIIKRRREGKSLLPMREKPPRPPHEIALEALDNLVKSTLLADGEVKQFYIELSDIIRTYIEGRYFIIALEMTTDQLIDNIRQSNVETDVIAQVRDFLATCDFVKFAKYRPGQDESVAAVKQAYDIINSTMLLPQFEEADSDTNVAKEESLDNNGHDTEQVEQAPPVDDIDETTEAKKEVDAS
ncbi:hypothetical protein JW960_23890 [candidate division KSB1 bacterium]|nr:hypothetical protein [candidate division KSB1 bacterium]